MENKEIKFLLDEVSILDDIDYGVDEISYYLEIAIDAVNDAKIIFNSGFGDISRFYKDTHGDIIDYATKTDRAIEERIRKLLETTNLDIHGEEFGGEKKNQGYCWIIDPIDGTLNYANNLPFASISLALAYNGSPILGVISTPKLNDSLYFGISNVGSWKNYKKIKVSERESREVVIAYDGLRGDQKDIYIEKLKKTFGRVRLLGTTATELALCSEGGFAAVFSPMAEFWDVAAGIAIVEGAGGVVRDLSGNIAKPGSGSIIAGSKECVDKIISLVNYN